MIDDCMSWFGFEHTINLFRYCLQMKVGRPQGGPNGMTAAQVQAAALAAAAGATYGQATASMPQLTATIPRPVVPATAAISVPDSTKTTVILDDMVPVAEASDPGLKGEVEEEASNYGPLKDIKIEVIDNKFVRIKLVYMDPPSAVKAHKAMNGRYFGGNVVKATII